MIRFMRTAAIAPGMRVEALAYAKTLSEYWRTQFGAKLEVLVPIGGNPHRIGWRTEYESLADMEAKRARVSADAKYQEMLRSGSGNFIAGSLNDVIWQTV